MRSPQLHSALRGFCLGAFAFLGREVETGAEIQFVFEEHGARDRPTLYEYRPLVRTYVETREGRLFALADTSLALEGSLFGEERAYAAVAPLVGLEAGGIVELGAGLRVRHAADGELGAHWPEATRLAPEGFGREPDRMCVLELERALPVGGSEPPDAPGEIADAVTALRLATAGPVAAGPVLFERLDWRPYGIRPVLPIAATPPPAEPTRLDTFRGALARELRARLVPADEDVELGEAIDRWELSLFQNGPFRSEQLRSALEALLGAGDGLWAAALRASVLLGETGRERAAYLSALRQLREGESEGAADLVRRALVEALRLGDRRRLVTELDEALLGVRPRPAGLAVQTALAS